MMVLAHLLDVFVPLGAQLHYFKRFSHTPGTGNYRMYTQNGLLLSNKEPLHFLQNRFTVGSDILLKFCQEREFFCPQDKE